MSARRFGKHLLSSAAWSLALVLGGIGAAAAQVAGSISVGAVRIEAEETVTGWSARHSIVGRVVYNAAGDKIGKAVDLIVGTDMRVAFVVVAAGARAGGAQHPVLVPGDRLHLQAGRIVLPDATQQSLAAMPAFVYAPITRTQSAIVERAQHDMDHALQAVAALERQAAQASGDGRDRAERRITQLRGSRQAVQDKLSEMEVAGAAQWQAVEAEVAQASARLRETLREPAP